jgi:hypothetical protein
MGVSVHTCSYALAYAYAVGWVGLGRVRVGGAGTTSVRGLVLMQRVYAAPRSAGHNNDKADQAPYTRLSAYPQCSA